MNREVFRTDDDFELPWLMGFGSVNDLSSEPEDEPWFYVPGGSDWTIHTVRKPRPAFGFQAPGERQ